MAERTETAAGKVTDGVSDAPKTAVDQSREVARAVFEKVKSARESGAKPVIPGKAGQHAGTTQVPVKRILKLVD
jgi:hypothetical protein